jgi:hypothetical protein
VLGELGELDAAEDQARRAIDILEIYLPSRAASLAVCARILLARGKLDEAQTMAEDAVELLESLGGIADGESLVRLTHCEALQAMGELDEAGTAIAVAHDRLVERAESITDERLRSSFLNEVGLNSRTLELATTWRKHIA